MNYDNLNLAPNLRPNTSLSQRPRDTYVNAIDEDLKVEKTPFINTVISKGTVQTTLGGLTEFKDTTGGTTIFTINPDTGNITIVGTVIANQVVNAGTVLDASIQGTSSLSGTMANTGIISGGSLVNNAFSGGTIAGILNSPSIRGTPYFETIVGTNPLTTDGGFALQLSAGSAILVGRINGTTFRFNSDGTL